jgi:hypothetical protein
MEWWQGLTSRTRNFVAPRVRGCFFGALSVESRMPRNVMSALCRETINFHVHKKLHVGTFYKKTKSIKQRLFSFCLAAEAHRLTVHASAASTDIASTHKKSTLWLWYSRSKGSDALSTEKSKRQVSYRNTMPERHHTK